MREARRLGEELRDEPLDLCVTSDFPRVVQTADLALEGRDVPRVVLPELGDPRYGDYEGRHADDYRAWAWTASAADAAPGGGESRAQLAARYARAFAAVLDRPEERMLVVCHQLPIAYLLAARAGAEPPQRVPWVEYATAYAFGEGELAAAAKRLRAWAAAPMW